MCTRALAFLNYLTIEFMYRLLARDTGLPSAAPLLRGYAKVEPLKIADLNNFIVTAPTQVKRLAVSFLDFWMM